MHKIPMIKTVDLEKIYKADSIETIALQKVNLDIQAGELIAITGPSGCGKSTLLNILGMVDTQDAGSYIFNGMSVAECSDRERTRLRKDNIGFIFQNFNLINELTVFENVELPLLYVKMSFRERKEKVMALLEQMKISHKKNHYPQQLSGGQQQRVAVARAISNDPKVILADEPTGNLDTQNGDEVMKQLIDLNEKGATVIIVTHSQHYAQYCKRTIRLLDGQVAAEQAKTTFYV